jgi:hypothetical protein
MVWVYVINEKSGILFHTKCYRLHYKLTSMNLTSLTAPKFEVQKLSLLFSVLVSDLKLGPKASIWIEVFRALPGRKILR